MSYEPTLVPKPQQFDINSDWDTQNITAGAVMTCKGCGQHIWIHSLDQAVAQADLHEQEKHLERVYEVPDPAASTLPVSA